MQITENSPDLLVLEDAGGMGWLFAGGSILAGIGMMVATPFLGEGEGNPIFFSIGGVFVIGIGIVFGLSNARIHLVFDRTDDELRMVQKRLRGSRTRRFPLDEVDGLQIERRDSTEGREVSRFVLHLTDGTKIPMSSVSTSSHKDPGIPETISTWLDRTAG